jgi:hypothetical protein
MLNHDDNTHHLYPNNVFTHSLVRALVIPMIPLYLLSTCSLLALSLSLLIGCGGIRFFYWDLFTRVTHRHHVPRDGGGGSTVILYNRYRNEIATLHRSSTHTHTHTLAPSTTVSILANMSRLVAYLLYLRRATVALDGSL